MKSASPTTRAVPTQADVAERAGVSRALVSLVLRGAAHVREEKRMAVLQAVQDLSYRPNGPAQLLAAKRTRLIGVLAQDLKNPFYGEVIEGLQQAAEQSKYRVLINTGHGQPNQEQRALETFLELRVDGVILISPLLADAHLKQVAHEVPTVVVSRDTSGINVDSVEVDEFAGGLLATTYLQRLGHRRIAYFDAAEDQQNWSSRMRRGGYEHAMTSAGLGRYTTVCAFLPDGTPPPLAALFQRDVDVPTAVFAHNDVCAVVLERALTEIGRRVPQDVAVVGYDNSLLASAGGTGLTSVDQPRDQLGHLALNVLLERIEGRSELRHHVLTPRLEIRGSTPTNLRPQSCS